MRFPRILSINQSEPAEFQDSFRKEYPNIKVKKENKASITIKAGLDGADPISELSSNDTINNYEFATMDNKWRINLTSTFLSLSTSAYSTWEEFERRFRIPLEAFIRIYQPAIIERVGLRYINAFRRSTLGLTDSSWCDLIKPYALGFLSDPQIISDVKGFTSTTEINIDNGATARITTLLGYIGEQRTQITKDTEKSFIIDNDIFQGKTVIEKIQETLDALHETSTRLIRHMITPKLHKAMEPQEL